MKNVIKISYYENVKKTLKMQKSMSECYVFLTEMSIIRTKMKYYNFCYRKSHYVRHLTKKGIHDKQ